MHALRSLSNSADVDAHAHQVRLNLDWRRVVTVAGIIVLSFPALAVPLFASLDSSWMIGLHEAVKRGLVFGRDVGFTYGPLGHVLFPLNEGTALTNSSLMLLALYTTWWISIVLIISRLRSYITMLLFMVGTLGFGIVGQREFLCTPSVILLATSGFLVVAQVSQRAWWAVPAAILTAIGLLSKFNIGIALSRKLSDLSRAGPFPRCSAPGPSVGSHAHRPTLSSARVALCHGKRFDFIFR